MKFNVNDLYNQADVFLGINGIHDSDFPRIEIGQFFLLSDFDGLNYYITDCFGQEIEIAEIHEYDDILICYSFLGWELQYCAHVKGFGYCTNEFEFMLNNVELI